MVSMFEHLKRRWHEWKKKKITKERIKILSDLESIIKTGTFRIFFCLSRVPMRFAELEEVTKLPRATLLNLLNYYKRLGLITSKNFPVEEPRKEDAPHYVLTKDGKEFIYNFTFLIDDTIQSIKIVPVKAVSDTGVDESFDFLKKHISGKLSAEKKERELRKSKK